ncbi:MAG: NADH-quinone oxidoreductase subunit L [bacterium]
MDQVLALLIPLLPLLGFVVLGLNKRLSQQTVAVLATGAVGVSFVIGVVLFAKYAGTPEPVIFRYFPWIQAGPLRVDFALQLDQLSLLMTLIVSGVGGLIHLYATEYMKPHGGHASAHDDGGYSRFFSYLNLFTGLMLILVLGANYVVMFVGWEGVGLASYLLIGFYYERWSATQAGKKAFLLNRVGDFCFMTGLVLLVTSALGTIPQADGSTLMTADYIHILPRAAELLAGPNYQIRHDMGILAGWISLCFFLGACGKSAQIPLFVWLPDAMEGPTPVSALIHAATMVTAGVYLLVRSNILFLMSPGTMMFVAIVAALTALFAATVAITQYDIKRVLAYSTISQLGYMFLAAGCGAFVPAIFHLMTHAFFKACLFLGAGSVIHGMESATGSHDPALVQDMRYMGGLAKKMPTTHWTMLASCAAIAGFPLTAGFFSKDAILHESFLMPFVPEGVRIAVVVVGYVTAALTAVYMFRLYYLTFAGEFRGIPKTPQPVGHHAVHETRHGEVVESPGAMTLPLQILAVLALVAGFLLVSPNFVPFEHYLAPVVEHSQLVAQAARQGIYGERAEAAISEAEGTAAAETGKPKETDLLARVALPAATWGNALPFYLISLLIALWGINFAKSVWESNPEKTAAWKAQYAELYDLARNAWYVDQLYHQLIVVPGMALFDSLWRGVDEGFIDDTLVEGTGRSALAVGRGLRRMQSGYLRAYAVYIIAGVALLLVLWLTAQGGH